MSEGSGHVEWPWERKGEIESQDVTCGPWCSSEPGLGTPGVLVSRDVPGPQFLTSAMKKWVSDLPLPVATLSLSTCDQE